LHPDLESLNVFWISTIDFALDVKLRGFDSALAVKLRVAPFLNQLLRILCMILKLASAAASLDLHGNVLFL